jgi:hypothetical protein
MKHIHHDAIVAWAAGAEIEYLGGDGNWYLSYPTWHKDTKYRIKQQPKPKIVIQAWLNTYGVLWYAHPDVIRTTNAKHIRVPELDKEIELS